MRIDHDMNSTYDSDRAFGQANAVELGRPVGQIAEVSEDIISRKKDAITHA